MADALKKEKTKLETILEERLSVLIKELNITSYFLWPYMAKRDLEKKVARYNETHCTKFHIEWKPVPVKNDDGHGDHEEHNIVSITEKLKPQEEHLLLTKGTLIKAPNVISLVLIYIKKKNSPDLFSKP